MKKINVLHDQHMHSCYSQDSKEKLENYFIKAYEAKCAFLVTTEHVDFHLVDYKTSWIADFNLLKKELKELQKKYPTITPLLGIEVGYKKNYIDLVTNIINSQDFDIVNLSIHEIPDVDFYKYSYFEKYGVDYLLNAYFDAMIEATKNFNNFDVLSHLDYGFKTAYLENKNLKISKYEDKIKQVFINLIENDKTFEINTKVQSVINDEHTIYLLNLYKSLGGKNISLSSDAHEAFKYRNHFDYYLKLIKNCGFNYLVYYVKREKHYYYI